MHNKLVELAKNSGMPSDEFHSWIIHTIAVIGMNEIKSVLEEEGKQIDGVCFQVDGMIVKVEPDMGQFDSMVSEGSLH